MKPILSLLFLLASFGLSAYSQEAPLEEIGADESKERVQYTLILPEEKTPEMIKPEEINPFEIAANDTAKEGDTEENRVRDILISMMPAVGGGSGPSGMRVMLGGMRLEAGQDVPPVIPDQQVLLKVKAITPEAIELVWIEKKPSGLPPKPFVIPMNMSTQVRYRLPSGLGDKASGGIGTIHRDGVSAFNRADDKTPVKDHALQAVISKAQPVDESPQSPPAPELAKPSNMPEASVLRMLFGNHAPQPK